MKLALVVGSLLLATTSLFAQGTAKCTTLRECQLRNTQLTQQVRVLQAENQRLNSDLYQCSSSSQGGYGQGDGRTDLLLSLSNKKFASGYWRENQNYSNEATIKFLFVNNTLRMQVTSSYGSTAVGNVKVPDQYGEFLSINHPGAVLNGGGPSSLFCDYIVTRDGSGVSKLELLTDIRNERYSCPKYFNLTR